MDGERAFVSGTAGAEARRMTARIKNVERDGVIPLDECDCLATTGKIAFEQAAITLFSECRNGEREEERKCLE